MNARYLISTVATLFVLAASAAAPTLTTAAAATGAGASGLPDERVYERVSNETYQGEVYAPTAPSYRAFDEHTEEVDQAAASGNAVAYSATPAGSNGSGLQNTWLAKRSADGWQAEDIAPVGSEPGQVFEAFSSELTTGILETSKPKLAADAPGECRDLYLRSSENGSAQPLITTADVSGRCGHPHFVGATSNFNVTLFQDEAALATEGREEAREAEVPEPESHYGSHYNVGATLGEPCDFSCNLYEDVAGQLKLVNVLPNGEADPNATFGGPAGAAGNEKNGPDLSDVISSDGSRIFWTDTKPGPDEEHVYVLEDGSVNVPVSGAGPAKYWTATPDGRYAYYTEDGDLWRFDTLSNSREELVGAGVKGEGAGVTAVAGVNQEGEDGAYVYMVATGVLTEDENSHGETAVAGEPNVYLLHAGAITFVAETGINEPAVTQNPEAEAGDWVATLGDRTAELSPDGRHLVFESNRPLTGYENLVRGGNVTLEAFVYSAESGQLDCVSCNPSGVPPAIRSAANLTVLPVSRNETYIPRWMSADGNRVFFMTYQPLVPQDTNGGQDVYEWEREGAASCPEVQPARLDGGCTFLLTGGQTADNSYLVDASVDGSDVFFVTRAQLVPEDLDEKLDLYDARVDGYKPLASLSCSGTGCQGVPPAPPIFATPASLTFEGVGNFEPASKTASGETAKLKKRVAKACGEGSVKRRGKCVRRGSKKGRRVRRSMDGGRDKHPAGGAGGSNGGRQR